MRILLIGATGTLGTALTRKLLNETEYELILFSRHAATEGITSDRTACINGDALLPEDVETPIAQSDAVICMVSGNDLPAVTQNIVDCMKKHKKARLIFTGAVGIYNEIPPEMDGDDNVDNEPAQIPNREGADIVEASDLKYTILRPGYLGEGDQNDYVLSLKGEPAKGYKTTIPSLTEFIRTLLVDDTLYIRESVSITKDMR